MLLDEVDTRNRIKMVLHLVLYLLLTETITIILQPVTYNP